MSDSTVYSVRVGPEVAKLKRGKGTRRRAGVEFATRAVRVSLAAIEGVTQVDEDSLALILADPHLRHKKEGAKAAKEVEPVVVEVTPEPEPVETEEAAPKGEKWHLKSTPEAYLKRMPDGPQADLARRIIEAKG